MCGRFESKADLNSLIRQIEQLDIELTYLDEDEPAKTINIAPTEKILSLTKEDDRYFLRKVNWGIKFSASSPLIFNSRIETISEKKFWNDLFDRNRCLIPMSAFYEWKKEGNKKIPYRIFLKDHDLFYVPGLFYRDKEKKTFVSLITTPPNEFIKNIHHRMPVIFTNENALTYFTNNAVKNLDNCIPYLNAAEMNMERTYL